MIKKIIFTFSFLTTLCFGVLAHPSSYNIEDYGAVNDGISISTQAINQAITACSENGGGKVVIPPGTFRSGTIHMKDRVELHLEIGATLLASSDHNDFPRQPQPKYRSQKDPGGWYSLIYADGVSNIAITGFGTIDGNGSLQKPLPGLPRNDQDGRTRNILFISCKKVRVEGIKMINAGTWNQHYLDCEDVMIDRVEVFNHSNRNNDAIDIDGCRRFVLSNSILDSDDDAITLKSTGKAATQDVVITNCVVSSFCNGIKAGTESTGGFRNICISNCVIKPSSYTTKHLPDNARRGTTGISLEIVDGGTMEGVAISNVTIEETKCPLYIRLGNRARKHTGDAPEPPVGTMRNLTLSNIVAYNTGNFSNSITAIPGHYIENVTIDNVQFFNQGGLKNGEYIAKYQDVKEKEKSYPNPSGWGNLPSSVLFIRHVKNLAVSNIMFGHNEPDPRVPIIAVDVKNLRILKGFCADSISPESFVLLDRVENYEIEKPLGWGDRKWITKY